MDIRLTLALSGRQSACGGAVESLRWPVHSRGLFEVSLLHRQRPQAFASTAVSIPITGLPMESSVFHGGGRYGNRYR
jgi:hypothetical protein